MRNRSILYFAGFMVAILGFLMFDYSVRREYLIKTTQQRNAASTETVAAEATANPVSDIGLRTRFLSRFKNFTTRMNALSEEPEQGEEFLKEFSQTIKDQDIIALSEILNDRNFKNDERTLALELLVMNQNFTSHELINTFVQNENFTARDNQEFEISLRAQAIEGLTLFADKKLVRKNLENLKIRTKHAFLHERADKAIQYLSNSNLTAPSENADASTR
ncbi:hypothetical protein CIK05_04190 [Bdellovibrio sp. qaytius]|nr:hypothetical protein CIK05_04190 [Bdellovibrio sp. qaytius]